MTDWQPECRIRGTPRELADQPNPAWSIPELPTGWDTVDLR